MTAKTPDADKRARAAGFTPHEPFPGTSKQWDTTCDACGVRRARYFKRILEQGCMECAGTSQGRWRAEKDIRDAGFIPVGSYRDARSDWDVTHSVCGEPVVIQVTNVRRGVGCGYCGGKQNKEKKAVEDFLAAGLTPVAPYPGANDVPWRSECIRCGTIVAPRLANVRSGRRCRECGGRAPLTAKKAAAVMMTKGFDPQEPYPGRRVAKWRCIHRKCGEPVTPTYKSAQRGIGCPRCDRQGFDLAAPAYVYVLTNDAFGAVKVGVGGTLTKRSRVKLLGRDGWEPYRVMTFPTGEDSLKVEKEVLRRLTEDMGLQPYVPRERMRFHGWTETFNTDDVSEVTLWTMVSAAARSAG